MGAGAGNVVLAATASTTTLIESIKQTGGVATSAVAAPLALGACANIVAFLFMTWASVAKPPSTTPWVASPTPHARAVT